MRPPAERPAPPPSDVPGRCGRRATLWWILCSSASCWPSACTCTSEEAAWGGGGASGMPNAQAAGTWVNADRAPPLTTSPFLQLLQVMWTSGAWCLLQAPAGHSCAAMPLAGWRQAPRHLCSVFIAALALKLTADRINRLLAALPAAHFCCRWPHLSAAAVLGLGALAPGPTCSGRPCAHALFSKLCTLLVREAGPELLQQSAASA